jgi:hypothetical protein
MSVYTGFQKTANRLLKGKGQVITITRQSAGTYDPATGTSTVTTSTQTGWGAIFEYDTKQAGIFNVPGSLIQVGDKQLLLSPLNSSGSALTAPAINDTVTDAAGKAYTVTQVKSMAPAGTVVLYELNLRGT